MIATPKVLFQHQQPLGHLVQCPNNYRAQAPFKTNENNRIFYHQIACLKFAHNFQRANFTWWVLPSSPSFSVLGTCTLIPRFSRNRCESSCKRTIRKCVLATLANKFPKLGIFVCSRSNNQYILAWPRMVWWWAACLVSRIVEGGVFHKLHSACNL